MNPPNRTLLQQKSLEAEQFHQLGLIETDYRLSVDDGYRGALKTLIKQFFQGRFVGANILFHELNALLR
jgi:hypothetical protein